MITLFLPDASEKYYAKLGNFLVGPFSLVRSSLNRDGIPFRAGVDFLSQGNELYHEKDVMHVQHLGVLNYQPIMSDVSYIPTVERPNQVSVQMRSFSGSGSTNVICNFGILGSGQGTINAPSTNSRTVYFPDIRSYHDFDIYSLVYGSPDSPVGSVTLKKQSYSFKNTSSSTIYYWIQTFECSVDLTKVISSWYALYPHMLPSLWDPSHITYTGTLSQVSSTMYTAYTNPSFVVDSFQGVLDSSIIDGLIEVETTPEPVDYGVLAKEASQKVNVNNVNMIAFLKDLRHPLDMVPKLKNMSKLKTHAGNYLAIKYGVLPTIDDLKSIVGAFEKVKPFIDSNGFGTYTSVRTSSETVAGLTTTLEQRIKLAIENDDSSLLDLISRIDSAGFLPTFENLWDLIPYSFVLDWFVDVGGFLERVDSRLRLMRQRIRYVTMSRKVSTVHTIEATKALPIFGTIQKVQYQRWTTDQCPVPPLFSANTPTVSNHWLEAGALITQRAKIKN